MRSHKVRSGHEGQCHLLKEHLKEAWASWVSAEPFALFLPGAPVSPPKLWGVVYYRERSLSNLHAAQKVESLEEGTL